MDTKLKKMRKRTSVLVTLCILLPAFLLVALYPRLGKVMQEKKREYDALNEKLAEELGEEAWTTVWELRPEFLNYAMEAAYYLYHTMTNEVTEVDDALFSDYGWINDYWKLKENVKYVVECDNNTAAGAIRDGNTEDLESEEAVGYLTLHFDGVGNVSEIELDGLLEVDLPYDADSLYEQANKTVKQLKNNIKAYEEGKGIALDEQQFVPKNFRMQIAIPEECDFTEIAYTEHTGYFHYTSTRLFVESGGFILMIAGALFVALMAFLLPLFKGLDTGWERIFCLPFEGLALLIAGGAGGAFGMYFAMHYTCYAGYRGECPELEILGFEVTDKIWFVTLLILNFLGWALLFFIEYVAISALRQLFCRPIYYVKNRILLVRVASWLKKQGIKLWQWVIQIDLNDKLNRSIIKIVLANFVVVSLLCVVWLVGLLGTILYSVLLFVGLYRYGKKMQSQYNSVLEAANQMAEGDLRVTLDKDLGLFQPIGDSLEKVQQGFKRAVVEEAKSQNMKTELITNVSHDLKTPLTAIITYVDLLKQENLSQEERKSYIQTLDQKSQRLKVLIEDLFEVSKANSGNVMMNFMDVDIVSLLKEVAFEMQDKIEESSLTFRWNLPDEKLILSLDSQRTYRVFANLFSNALQYALPNSRVYVDVISMDGEVKITIRNISAQELNFDSARLTERFVRGDVSRNSEGSGLGLAIAKSFVELQNGTFEIHTDGDLFKVVIIWNK